MTDFYDEDDNDNEAWDVGGSEPFHVDYYYGPDEDDGYEDPDEFDCGMVDDKRLCADIGSEHCSFFCPFHAIAMARNPDDYPAPEGYEDDANPPEDDIPF